MGEECIALQGHCQSRQLLFLTLAHKPKLSFSTGCQYFIGEEYFPLRKEFQLFSGNKTRSPNNTELVVSMGGGDVFENNKILEALGQILDDR